MSEFLASDLQTLAEEQKTTVTNIVRKAIGVYKFLNDELDDDHKGRRTLQIVEEDNGHVTRIAII